MGLINQLNANELGHHLVVVVYPNFTYLNGGREDIASFRTFIISSDQFVILKWLYLIQDPWGSLIFSGNTEYEQEQHVSIP